MNSDFDFDTRVLMWCSDLLRANSDELILHRCNECDEHNISTVYFNKNERKYIYDLIPELGASKCAGRDMVLLVKKKFNISNNFHKDKKLKKLIKLYIDVVKYPHTFKY